MEKVRPKKNLGQHFLTDQNIARKLAELVSISGFDQILEVGPGMGILTSHLMEIDNSILKLVEIDSESVLYLKSHFPKLTSQIIEADFLKFDLKEAFKTPFALCGNYPYNISSQIVFKMLQFRSDIPFMAGMFQLEMAKRIAAGPNNKDYGILSVLTQAFYEVNLEFIIEPGAFHPPPKVRSAVISCKRRDNFQIDCNEILFFSVVKAAFGQRRKMLINSISKFNIPKETLHQNEILKLRAENLTVADFVRLTNFIESHRKQ